VIAASAIAPTYARKQVGVERSASLTGVTKAVSVGVATTRAREAIGDENARSGQVTVYES